MAIPVFEAELRSRRPPYLTMGAALALLGAVLGAVLAVLSARCCGWFGDRALFGAVGAAATAAACAALYDRFARQVRERIVVSDGGIRLSRYVSGRLVEQRRIKSAGLAIEVTQEGERRSCAVTLRERPGRAAMRRSFEIARGLPAAQVAQFLEGFVEGLRRTGQNPQIFMRPGTSKAC
jgi:hypothetical protein